MQQFQFIVGLTKKSNALLFIVTNGKVTMTYNVFGGTLNPTLSNPTNRYSADGKLVTVQILHKYSLITWPSTNWSKEGVNVAIYNDEERCQRLQQSLQQSLDPVVSRQGGLRDDTLSRVYTRYSSRTSIPDEQLVSGLHASGVNAA